MLVCLNMHHQREVRHQQERTSVVGYGQSNPGLQRHAQSSKFCHLAIHQFVCRATDVVGRDDVVCLLSNASLGAGMRLIHPVRACPNRGSGVKIATVAWG